MAKHRLTAEMPTKIRKRGCSSSSSSSSRIHHYRLNKRAIVVGRSRARSGTPAPPRSAVDSPSCSTRSAQPVSARRLAATLWEMNEIPSPADSEAATQRLRKSGTTKAVFKREKMQSGWGLRSSSAASGSLPPPSPTISEVDFLCIYLFLLELLVADSLLKLHCYGGLYIIVIQEIISSIFCKQFLVIFVGLVLKFN